MIELLKKLDQKPNAPMAGYWRPVLFSPDPATGERITVGIALNRESGEARFRWLASFERLKRVFGNESARHLPFLIRHAANLISNNQAPDTAHLHFGETRELWTSDIEKSLDDLFHRFVPLARDFEAPSRPQAAVQNRRLIETVYKRLKQNPNVRISNLIPQNPLLRSAERPARYLNVPLQGIGRFATLVSAQARNLSTIDRNIYPAVAELNAAAKIHKIKNVAVFLLRPNENEFSPEEYEVIDEHVHQTMFVLKNEGVKLIPEINTDLVTSAVEEWGLH